MDLASSAPSLAAADVRDDHIVDILIAERAPKLAASAAWPLLRPVLYAFLDYAKARRMADAIAPLPGRAALELVSELLSIQVETRGLERLPRQGRLIVIVNHPTGIGDGVAVYDVIKTVRPDVVFYANADAHRVCPGFADVLIPVEWVEAKRTRERTRQTLIMTRQAMEEERALVIFPAGRIARRTAGVRTTDPPWAASAFSVARKYDAPISPIHLSGPWPALFHLFDGLSTELRDITLFHELLNKRGKRFRLTVGPTIHPGALPHDAGEAAEAVKRYVETELAADADRPFES
jgi:putative hemolysin